MSTPSTRVVVSLRRERLGVFVTDWRDFHPDFARWLFALGYRWAAFHGHEGERDPEPYGLVDKATVQATRDAGLEPIMWGSVSADNPEKRPVQTALRAARARAAIGANAYIANIEIPYDDRTFLKQWRLVLPKMTTWLSCGLTDPRVWSAWFKAGAIVKGYPVATAWLPQCYLNVNPGARPLEADNRALNQYGIPLGVVKPTIAEWDDERYPTDLYLDELRETKQVGFSVYHSGSCSVEELTAFGRGVAEGLAAT